MPNALAIIPRIVSQHYAVRGHIKLAGDTVNDIEALFALRRTQSGWSQTSIKALVEKRDQLLQTISFLEGGLENHFDSAEEALPPLLGMVLTKAIMHEHRNISGQLGSAKTTLANIELRGLDQRQLLSRKSVIQRSIDSPCQTVEEHGQCEETILNMINEALERNESSQD